MKNSGPILGLFGAMVMGIPISLSAMGLSQIETTFARFNLDPLPYQVNLGYTIMTFAIILFGGSIGLKEIRFGNWLLILAGIMIIIGSFVQLRPVGSVELSVDDILDLQAINLGKSFLFIDAFFALLGGISGLRSENKIPKEQHYDWLKKGYSQLSVGDQQGAIESFKKSLDIKRSFSNGRLALYETLIELGRNEEAINVCEEGVKVRPKYQWLWFYLGEAYKANKEYDKAILAYERALIQWKTYKKPMFGLISIYRMLGKDEKVMQYSELMTKPRKEILELRKILRKGWK